MRTVCGKLPPDKLLSLVLTCIVRKGRLQWFTHQMWKYEHLIVWAVHRDNKSGPCVEVLVEIRL